MKKIISIILTISFIISTFGVSVFAEDDSINRLQAYINKVNKLTIDFDTKANRNNENIGLLSETAVYETEDNSFESCRLILKSSKYPEELNSLDIVYGYKDYYIVQFGNEFDTEEAYKHYCSADYVTDVDIDVQIMSRNTGTLRESQATEENSSDIVPTRLESWGGYASGTYYVKDYIEENNLATEEIVVAVLDTGVETQNEFLKDRLIRTYYNTTGLDDTTSEECNYDDYHGTAVTSIIVDNTPENVKVANYKMFSENSSTSTMLKAANAMLQAMVDGVDIISTSFGCSDTMENFDYALDIMEDVYKSGIIITTAVENGGGDTGTCPTFPDCSPYGFNISSSSESGWPDGGYHGKTVHLCAPGIDVSVASTGNRYGTVSGTSFSSPLTASVCAMYLTLHPDATPDEIINAITETTSPFVLEVPENLYGTGILNAIAACGLEQAPCIPVITPEGKYHEEVRIELKAPEGCEIRYTLNDTDPEFYDYEVYSEPITLDTTSAVYARAYKNGVYRSDLIRLVYRVTTMATDDMFTINEDGVIVSYTGTAVDIIIPEVINGITVTGLYDTAFGNSCDKNLVGVTFPDSITYITGFRGNETVQFVDAEGGTEIGASGFRSSNIVNIHAPNVEKIGYYSFASTWCLQEINFPKLKLILNNAFENSALFYAYLPEVEEIQGYAFSDCWLLSNFYAPKLTALYGSRGSEGRQFMGCELLKELDLEHIGKINTGTFDCKNTTPCGVELIEFSNVQTIKSLPYSNEYEDTHSEVTLVLPSTLTECCAPTKAAKDSYTVYGSIGNIYAQTWAADNGETFIELTENNAIHADIPAFYRSGDDSITFGAYGFNRKYQWYGAYTNSLSSGEIIENATTKSFNPEDYKLYPYYYCKMTSTDINTSNEVISEFTVTSSICRNTLYCIYGTEKTDVDFTNRFIYTKNYAQTNIDNIVGIKEATTYYYRPSYIYRKTQYYGTGSTLDVCNDNGVWETFTLIVQGDVNGDSAVDVLDAVDVHKASTGKGELTGDYLTAADADFNGEIDVYDYAQVINLALA